MLLKKLIVSSLIATAVAMASPKAAPMPHRLVKMSPNQAFGLLGRQENGYAPSQNLCGEGDDCPTACGADTTQCPSTDGDLHCKTDHKLFQYMRSSAFGTFPKSKANLDFVAYRLHTGLTEVLPGRRTWK